MFHDSIRSAPHNTQEIWRNIIMEDGNANTRRWEDLDINILTKNFKLLDMFELMLTISGVCRAWRRACCDPLLWETLDLSMLQSNFIKIPLKPYVYVNAQSDRTLTRILKISSTLSGQSIVTLIFHFDLYVNDEQLKIISERCPQVRRLVLPAWNRIKKTGICRAVQGWKELESLTMPSIMSPRYVFEEISTHCKNFRELKIMGTCGMRFALSLAECLPNLRVLSIRCSMLKKDVLLFILDNLHHLKVLNISHCILMEDLPPAEQHTEIIKEIDESIRQKANRLDEFLTCIRDSCIMCQRTRADEGIVRWYRYEEGLWKKDEVKSLTL